MKKLAYSYIRFSSKEQEQGDSLRRQAAGAEAFCEVHDLELVESYQDLGKSAFNGTVSDRKRLSEFLKACEEGKVKRGSTLIVENLDRLSRGDIMSAMGLLTSIIEYVDLGIAQPPYRIYKKDEIIKQPFSLMELLVVFIRANEESAAKSKRLGAAWRNKKDNASSESPVTSRVPFWLKCEAGKIQEVEGRSLIVQEIFDRCTRGEGVYTITKSLNERNIKPFGRGKIWHASYVQKLLNNKAVYGEYQPYKKQTVTEIVKEGRKEIELKKRVRLPDGAPVPNYYPVIISKQKFDRAHFCLKNRRGKAGRKGNTVGKLTNNLFTHVLKDGVSGNAIQFANKGHNQYIIPTGSKEGQLGYYVSWNYEDFERVMFNELSRSPHKLEHVTYEKEIIEEDEVDVIETELSKIDDAEEKLLDVLESGQVKSELAAKRLTKYNDKREALRAKLKEIQQDRNIATWEEYVGFMKEVNNSADKIRESVELREKFKNMLLSNYTEIKVWFEGTMPRWNHNRRRIAELIKTRGPSSIGREAKAYLRKLVELHRHMREVTYCYRARPDEVHGTFDKQTWRKAGELYSRLAKVKPPEEVAFTRVFLDDLEPIMRDWDQL